MAYQKVTNVASMDAVLGSIATFISSLGTWTIDNNLGAPSVEAAPPVFPAPDTRAGGRILIAEKGDCLVCLRSTTTNAGANRLFLLDGIPPYSSGNDATLNGNSGLNTAGAYTVANVISATGAIRGFQQVTGPFPNLYLFSNATGDYVHVVLEIFAGVFRHMLFGNLTKFGTWTGGGYYASTWWDQSTGGGNPISNPAFSGHFVPFDNQNGNASQAWTVHYEHSPDKWITTGPDNATGGVQRREGRGSVRGGFNTMFKNITESLFSGLIPLAPVLIGAVRESDSPATTRFIGQVPDFRMINITNLSPADEFSIGADTWKVFPMCAKNGITGQNSSLVAGFAYKKIP